MYAGKYVVQVRGSAVLIEIQRLHPSEFDLLKGYADGFCPDPEHSIAMVLRNDSRIIGRLFAVAPVHVEGVHIDIPWRGGTLFKDMMNAMELELKSENIKKVFAYAVRPEVGHYIEHRCGYKPLAWKIYEKEIPCRHF